MKKVIVVGKGSFLAEHLPYSTITEHVEISQSGVQDVIEKYKPDVIVNCAAFTGTFGKYKNIDGCEADKARTVSANLTLPTLLATETEKRDIQLVQISSGCIFYGSSPNLGTFFDHGWREKDFANPLSFYSKVKYACDLSVGAMPNVFTPRIRMPISSKNNPRNLINKLIGFENVLEEPNSVTFLDDLVRAIAWAIDNQKTGIYHVTNPEPMTHIELLKEYQKYKPDHKFNIIDKEQLKQFVEAPRRNCIIDSSKLKNEGFQMTETKEALAKCMKEYFNG